MAPLVKKIPTANGQTLSVSFFDAAGEIKGTVIIAAAMGVGQRYYQPFAEWLAGQGYLVATFDYSGTGLSQVESLRESQVNISDWAQFDCAAVIEAVVKDSTHQPLFWIGHSLGGQVLGLVPNAAKISKVITVASGSGYWLENTASLKWKVWWLWYVVVPLITRIYGYFPGKRLRKVGDLPRGVMEQWRRWCLNPEYLIGVEGSHIREKYAAVKFPITSFSFTDDEMMSQQNIVSFHGFYSSSSKKMKRISPDDVGEKRIGHFGFFKEKYQQCLWVEQLLPELQNK